MSIPSPLAALLLAEHRHRRFGGRFLTLGRQTVCLNAAQLPLLLSRAGLKPRPGLNVQVDTVTRQAKQEPQSGYLRDSSFFASFCGAQVEAMDVTAHEEAEIIHDICQPPPARLHGRFDVIFNGNMMDHLFDPAAALRHVSQMLKPDGRVIHLGMASRLESEYLIYSPDWFLDYYAANGFADCRVYICTFTNSRELYHGPWDVQAYFPCEQGRKSCSLREVVTDQAVLVVVAEKKPDSDWRRSAVSWCHRDHAETNRTLRGLRTFAASTRPVFGFGCADPPCNPLLDGGFLPCGTIEAIPSEMPMRVELDFAKTIYGDGWGPHESNVHGQDWRFIGADDVASLHTAAGQERDYVLRIEFHTVLAHTALDRLKVRVNGKRIAETARHWVYPHSIDYHLPRDVASRHFGWIKVELDMRLAAEVPYDSIDREIPGRKIAISRVLIAPHGDETLNIQTESRLQALTIPSHNFAATAAAIHERADRGELSEAIDLCRQALKTTSHLEYHVILGDLLFRSGANGDVVAGAQAYAEGIQHYVEGIQHLGDEPAESIVHIFRDIQALVSRLDPEAVRNPRVFNIAAALVNQFVMEFIPRVSLSCFWGDKLLTLDKSAGFLDGPDGQIIRREAGRRVQDQYAAPLSISWRLHTLIWAARSALKLEGDFVECGVYRGDMSAAVMEILAFEKLNDRTFWLFDSFEGMDPKTTRAEDYPLMPNYYAFAQKHYADPTIHRSVVERFEPYANVRVIKGNLPESLKTRPEGRIAYLHIDLNAAVAETGVLEALFPQVVPGGMMVFDDYGWIGLQKQKVAADTFAQAHGHSILELPTGQGLMVKHHS